MTIVRRPVIQRLMRPLLVVKRERVWTLGKF